MSTIPIPDRTERTQDGDQLQIDASTVVDQRELGMTWGPLGMTRARATLHVQALLRRER